MSEFITRENDADDAWVCLCGNQPHVDGFYAVSGDREVDPTPEEWGGVEYVCLSCGRVIDQNTLQVTRRLTRLVTLGGPSIDFLTG